MPTRGQRPRSSCYLSRNSAGEMDAPLEVKTYMVTCVETKWSAWVLMNKTPTDCKKMCVCVFVLCWQEGKERGKWKGREVESCKFGAQTNQSIVSWTLGIRTRWGWGTENKFPNTLSHWRVKKRTWVFLCLGGPDRGVMYEGVAVCNDESEQGWGGAEGGGERNLSGLHAGCWAWCEAWSHAAEMMTWAKTKSRKLYKLGYPAAPPWSRF